MNNSIKLERINGLLGFSEDIPLDLETMIADLKVTFYQISPISNALNKFYNFLKLSFLELGVEVLDFEHTLDQSGKVKPNIAVFVAGMDDEYLMINHVSTLYKNPIIGLFEGECPAKQTNTNQEKLDAVVSVLAYDVVHLAIFIDDKEWTICTMNGAIVPTALNGDLKPTILDCLIPKLTAQVVPPDVQSDISRRFDLFDPADAAFKDALADMSDAARLLKENGLIMSHTSVDSLKHKSKFHERIVRAYLDDRSGMSYGFMSWQMPVTSKPAVLVENGQNNHPIDSIPIDFLGKTYLVHVPEVSVLVTRSGCDKTNLDVTRDIVRMNLSKGLTTLDLPLGTGSGANIKPSYDTHAILAHALGNSIVSSLLKTVVGDNTFSEALEEKGLSLFHWHGYLSEDQLPEYHFAHGESNPSVSCSTSQSAVFSFNGKIEALENSIKQNELFLGDIHIEPHHGTNISSTQKLSEVVELLQKYYPVENEPN